MGFLLAHSAWQIDQFPTCWPINGLFVHWSGAEGCCRSLNALLVYILESQLFGKLGMLDGGGGGGGGGGDGGLGLGWGVRALMVFVLFIYHVK